MYMHITLGLSHFFYFATSYTRVTTFPSTYVYTINRFVILPAFIISIFSRLRFPNDLKESMSGTQTQLIKVLHTKDTNLKNENTFIFTLNGLGIQGKYMNVMAGSMVYALNLMS